MPPITFSIQNPGAQPADQAVLYIGQKNTLHFVFTSETISELKPSDQFTVKIPGSLVDGIAKSNFKDDNWEVKSFTPPGTGSIYYTFVLSPRQTIVFSSAITLVFTGISANLATNDTVTVNFSINGRSLPGCKATLAVMSPPDQVNNLNDFITFQAYINEDNNAGVTPGKVFVSPVNTDNKLDKVLLPISNGIKINLKYNGHSELVDHWEQGKPPAFIFSFSYGDNVSDLTDAYKVDTPGYNALTTAWNINAVGIETSQWTIPQQSIGTDAPHWTINPLPSNQHLFSDKKPNLDVLFNHIITILPPGDATLYIQWTKIPGFNDGIKALNIVKTVPAVPQITSFTGPDGQRSVALKNLSDPLLLEWETFAATKVSLYWADGNKESASFPVIVQSGQPLGLSYPGKINGAVVPVAKMLNFYLTAFDANNHASKQAGPIVVTVDNFEGPVIESFDYVILPDGHGGYALQLKWQVRNAVQDTYAQIIGYPEKYPAQAPDGIEIPLSLEKPLQDSYTLKVVDEFAGLSTEKSIQPVVPQSFMPGINRLAGQLTRALDTGDARLELTVDTTDLGIGGYLTVNGGERVPHRQGGQVLSYGLSPQAPLQAVYRVEACNLLLQRSTHAVLKVFYMPDQVPELHMEKDIVGLHLLPLDENDHNLLLTRNTQGDVKVAYFSTKVLPKAPLPTISLGIKTYIGSNFKGESVTEQFLGLSSGPHGNVYVNSCAEGTYKSENLAWFDARNLTNPVVRKVNMRFNAFRTVLVTPDETALGYFWYTPDYRIAPMGWDGFYLPSESLGIPNTSALAAGCAIAGTPNGNTVFLLNIDGEIVRAPWLSHADIVAETELKDFGLDMPDMPVYKRMYLTAQEQFYIVGDNTYLAYFDMPKNVLKKYPIDEKANNVTVSRDQALVFIADIKRNLHVYSGVTNDMRLLQTIPNAGLKDVAVSADNTRLFLSTGANVVKVLTATLVVG